MKVERIILNSDAPILFMEVFEPAKMMAIVQMPDEESQPALSVWDYHKHEMIAVVEKGPGTGIFAACFSHSGKYLWYFHNGRLCRYEIRKGETQDFDITDRQCRNITADREFLLVCGEKTFVVDLSNLSLLWELPGYESGQRDTVDTSQAPANWKLKSAEEYTTGPAMGVFHNKGTSVLISGNNRPTIQFYEILGGKLSREISGAPYQTNAITVGNNETRLVVSALVPYADFAWDLTNNELLHPELFNTSIGGSSSIAMHATKNWLASGSLVGYVSLLDLGTGKFLFSEDVHTARVTQVRFIGTEAVIAGSEDGSVSICRINT